MFPHIRDWLRPGGYFLAIVGAGQWTGTAPYLGADMFWDHADTATYLRWLQAARLRPIWNRCIPGGEQRAHSRPGRGIVIRANRIPPAAERGCLKWYGLNWRAARPVATTGEH